MPFQYKLIKRDTPFYKYTQAMGIMTKNIIIDGTIHDNRPDITLIYKRTNTNT